MLLYRAWCRTYQLAFRIASPLLPWREPELIQGPGSLLQLPLILSHRGISNILVVTDSWLSTTEMFSKLLKGMSKQGIACSVYDKTVPNPTIANIEEALQLYHLNHCQTIVAFGGGSPMDCAKGVGARVARPNKPIAAMKGVLKVLSRLPLLVAIPTTAGTGSEATLAAVISNPETHEKYPINDHALIPRLAVLDPMLTVDLPAHLTSTTGMDALTHAVEAFIGQSNTRNTEIDAIEATQIILSDLCDVYANGHDIQKREHMLHAAYLAGKAFTRAYVGYVHAIAHTLGGFYKIPHGLANSIILPHMLDWYGSAIHTRLARLARSSGLVTTPATDAEASRIFIDRVREMNRTMAIPEYISGIQAADIPAMVNRALSEANPLYPVPKIMDRQDMQRMFSIISGGAAT